MSNYCGYYDRSGNFKSVKNLDWLLRHAHEVARIEIRKRAHGGAVMKVYACEDARWTWYETTWASHDLLMRWIVRPRFFGIFVQHKPTNKEYKIGRTRLTEVRKGT